MTKKIVNIICSYEYPSQYAAANRIDVLARTIAKSHRVNVVTLSEDARRKSFTLIDNRQVHYVSHKLYDKTNFLNRSFHELIIAIKLVRASARLRADITVVSIPFMFLLPCAVIAGGSGSKILDIRDLVWEYLPENSLAQRLIKKRLAAVMKLFSRGYKRIATSNEYEAAWACSVVGKQDVELVSNGIEREKFLQLRTVADGRVAHSTDVPHVVYAGNIGLAQRLDVLVEVAREMPDVSFTLAGAGNDMPRIRALIEDCGLTNISLPGMLNRDEIFRLFKTADVLFAQLDETFASAVPSKLYEYLSTGLPLVYAGLGEAPRLLGRFENVYTLPPCNPKILRETLAKVFSDIPAYSLKNIDIIEQFYIREDQADKYLKLIESLTP
jgi:glycosyltransferase involved in cell wall biosynthesis